jgi:hypothetical protein
MLHHDDDGITTLNIAHNPGRSQARHTLSDLHGLEGRMVLGSVACEMLAKDPLPVHFTDRLGRHFPQDILLTGTKNIPVSPYCKGVFVAKYWWTAGVLSDANQLELITAEVGILCLSRHTCEEVGLTSSAFECHVMQRVYSNTAVYSWRLMTHVVYVTKEKSSGCQELENKHLGRSDSSKETLGAHDQSKIEAFFLSLPPVFAEYLVDLSDRL